ncbi:hypothetical protein GCM10010216_53630 [Streptomyces flaveolus]|nr:hypothetical protein GCM10010216_53630 [Streptomyces flaveolus]
MGQVTCLLFEEFRALYEVLDVQQRAAAIEAGTRQCEQTAIALRHCPAASRAGWAGPVPHSTPGNLRRPRRPRRRACGRRGGSRVTPAAWAPVRLPVPSMHVRPAAAQEPGGQAAGSDRRPAVPVGSPA